ncbi:MAG: WYL domain-containing transcriptional regulator [Pyramidobacter sp.]|nr:WYL domain-containing transcriptional regulator [Pyramidobacter sp.]
MENDSRIRILRILEVLRTETDQDHPITIVEIVKLLNERWNLDAHRITVQKDIASLMDAGYPIEAVRSTQNRYYMTEQLFELPELKLLIDAVESGKFITEKKSRELTEKLTSLAVRSDRESLKRNISISDRVKTGNEQLYYIMDALNEAINRKRKVSFLYFEYHAGKKKKLRNEGEPYVLSPYTLTWNGDFYYVVGWSDKHEKIATFRVDRIYRVPEILEEKAVRKPKQYSIGDFAEKAFQMFDREHATVELLCVNEAMNTVIDHFGTKIRTEQTDEDHFRFKAEVSLSPVFFAWVFQFGGMIKIVGPLEVLAQYRKMLRQQIDWDRSESVMGICGSNTREKGFMISTQCPFCSQETEIPINLIDLFSWEVDGLPAQDAFPYLTDDQREMIISGTCPSCWCSLYEQDED